MEILPCRIYEWCKLASKRASIDGSKHHYIVAGVMEWNGIKMGLVTEAYTNSYIIQQFTMGTVVLPPIFHCDHRFLLFSNQAETLVRPLRQIMRRPLCGTDVGSLVV